MGFDVEEGDRRRRRSRNLERLCGAATVAALDGTWLGVGSVVRVRVRVRVGVGFRVGVGIGLGL